MQSGPKNPEIDQEATAKAQQDPVYLNYKQWLIDNNCKFPSVNLKIA